MLSGWSWKEHDAYASQARAAARRRPCDRTPGTDSICHPIGQDEGRNAGTQTLSGVCLKQQFFSPFSPSAFQASLQTSIFQARNRTTGAAMSLIKKSDVKNHLSPRFRTKIHLCQPESAPDATGCSVAEPDEIQTSPLSFNEDFVREHSFSGSALAQRKPVVGSIVPLAPASSKCVQS